VDKPLSEPLTKELIKEVGKNEILPQCGLLKENVDFGPAKSSILAV